MVGKILITDDLRINVHRFARRDGRRRPSSHDLCPHEQIRHPLIHSYYGAEAHFAFGDAVVGFGDVI
jgi:hypothetical protein